MEQALVRARQFGKTDYLYTTGFKLASVDRKKQKSPLALQQQISYPTPVRKTSINLSEVIERPETYPEEYKLPLEKLNLSINNSNQPVKTAKYQFICSGCSVPLFSSKDFMPHSAKQIQGGDPMHIKCNSFFVRPKEWMLPSAEQGNL